MTAIHLGRGMRALFAAALAFAIGMVAVLLLACRVEERAPRPRIPTVQEIPDSAALDSVVSDSTYVEPGADVIYHRDDRSLYRNASYAVFVVDTMRVPVQVWGVPLPTGASFQVRYTWGKPPADSAFTLRLWRSYPAPDPTTGKVMVADTVPVPLPAFGDSVGVRAWVRLRVGTITSSWLSSPIRYYVNGKVVPPDSVRLGQPIALLIKPDSAALLAIWDRCAAAIAIEGDGIDNQTGQPVPACGGKFGRNVTPLQQFCCFGRFEDGAVAQCGATQDLPFCQTIYTSTFPNRRPWAKIMPSVLELERGRMVLARLEG